MVEGEADIAGSCGGVDSWEQVIIAQLLGNWVPMFNIKILKARRHLMLLYTTLTIIGQSL